MLTRQWEDCDPIHSHRHFNPKERRPFKKTNNPQWCPCTPQSRFCLPGWRNVIFTEHVCYVSVIQHRLSRRQSFFGKQMTWSKESKTVLQRTHVDILENKYRNIIRHRAGRNNTWRAESVNDAIPRKLENSGHAQMIHSDCICKSWQHHCIYSTCKQRIGDFRSTNV